MECGRRHVNTSYIQVKKMFWRNC